MPHMIWPPEPHFKSDGERELFAFLKGAIGENDALLANLRFTDPQNGDIEVDIVLILEGFGVVVIESKGGSISYDGQKWVQRDSSGSRSIDPQEQVIKNLYAVREFLRHNWKYGNIKAEWLLSFSGSLIGRVQVPGLDRNRILDRAETNQALQRAKEILSANASRKIHRQPDWVAHAFETLKGHAFLETDRDKYLESNLDYVRDLTHERGKILDLVHDNQRIYVRGPAGSGKTWLAYQQAIRWSEQGLRVGIAVFNRGLNSYMQRKNAELVDQPKPAWVGTFHKFAMELGVSAGLMDQSEAQWKEQQQIMLEAVENLKDSEKFDAWIVDEAQDFHDSWWQVLETSLKNSETGRLAIFGDPDQSVYGQRGVPEGHFAIVRLSENLRNCHQIAESVRQFIDAPMSARGPLSYEVEYVEVAGYEDVIAAADDVVGRLVDEELWEVGEIALLTTMHQHPVQKENLEVGKEAFWELLWEGKDVFYSTSNGFKGLERSAIVLAIDGFHDPSKKADVLYVGMTRARDRLVVVGTAEDLAYIQNGDIED